MTHFLDIGANIGQTFPDYLDGRSDLHGCAVWCFEPSPRHLAGLLNTIDRYSSRFSITVCPYGFHYPAGFRRFHEKNDPRGDSLLESFWQGVEVKDRNALYAVNVYTPALSSWLQENTAPEDTVIVKIDAEGSEYAILRDLIEHPHILKRVSELFVEFHTVSGESSTELGRQIEALGVRLQRWMY